jgi:putative oxidoreductase
MIVRVLTVTDSWLDARRDLAPLLFRLFLAFVFIYGTQDNVFSVERMHEFRDFLERFGFPYPPFSAYLGVYVQFIGGILLALGLFTRPVAAVLVVNWIIAIVMVHWGWPWERNIAVLALLIGSVFFVLYGAPRYSLDAVLRRRRAGRSGRPVLVRGCQRNAPASVVHAPRACEDSSRGNSDGVH